MTERFVVLGLARPDRDWFRDLAHWSTTGRIPVEFVKCVSADEVSVRLDGGRRFSALLLDPAAHGADRELVDVARSHGLAVLAVDDPRLPREWRAFGVTAVLPARLEPHDVLLALDAHASAVESLDHRAADAPAGAPTWQSPLVAVVGRGGSGTSVVSLGLAQGLGRDPRYAGSVLLADLALHADQALLHDVGDVVPGLPELVEAHRLGVPARGEVQRLTHADPRRGYRVLLGLRRHRDWTRLRRRAVLDALASLRREFRVVVADTDADLEGELDCGSADVEERNVLARAAVGLADVVVVTGSATVTGLTGLVTVVDDLVAKDVDVARILPVVTRSSRSLRTRAELTRTLAALLSTVPDGDTLISPVHLPSRRNVDDVLRDAAPLPAALSQPLVTAVLALLGRVTPRPTPIDRPVPVEAGSLGHWEVEAG